MAGIMLESEGLCLLEDVKEDKIIENYLVQEFVDKKGVHVRWEHDAYDSPLLCRFVRSWSHAVFSEARRYENGKLVYQMTKEQFEKGLREGTIK
ncbi:hypothetical protein SYNTR_0712 [Candidatus Syntrophocurvum alkaliphilum]|uniref:Uncharacterized protein n=1 Tax=Candidatus Syntrophocurvum alkaliphilum TaxID=2293317 RepID=A0A6I6D8V5_9FIRM|nr:hypothetical protein [Candidatus Syntrophocurvum alkaliphilum]QGT99305.1 hypothetical protein SYNTR_0712 [Candidatus Syntrophocurvum alkaliphilum]